MKTTIHRYECDECGKEAEVDTRSVGNIDVSGSPEGWVAANNEHFCESCAREITVYDMKERR